MDPHFAEVGGDFGAGGGDGGFEVGKGFGVASGEVGYAGGDGAEDAAQLGVEALGEGGGPFAVDDEVADFVGGEPRVAGEDVAGEAGVGGLVLPPGGGEAVGEVEVAAEGLFDGVAGRELLEAGLHGGGVGEPLFVEDFGAVLDERVALGLQGFGAGGTRSQERSSRAKFFLRGASGAAVQPSRETR